MIPGIASGTMTIAGVSDLNPQKQILPSIPEQSSASGTRANPVGEGQLPVEEIWTP
ncbi:MAG: hypothetical protein ACO1QB_10320 [Verrucomicrobiales bacterium]